MTHPKRTRKTTDPFPIKKRPAEHPTAGFFMVISVLPGGQNHPANRGTTACTADNTVRKLRALPGSANRFPLLCTVFAQASVTFAYTPGTHAREQCRTERPRPRPPGGCFTGHPYRSASICRHIRLRPPPPHTAISSTDTPISRNTSTHSRWEYATPSSTARIRLARSCIADRPKNTPRQSGSGCGERSPIRYGRYSSRPAPIGTSAAFSSIMAYTSRPSCAACICSAVQQVLRSHCIESPALWVQLITVHLPGIRRAEGMHPSLRIDMHFV